MSVKDSTFDTLVDFYKDTGDLKKFLLICHAMVCAKESTAVMRGEIAETVLYVMLDDYIKKNNITDWRIVKGMILKDIDTYKSHEYFTELDLTLFTPKCVFSFECKCYKGPKYLSDRGTLHVKRGKSFKKALDVFDQHSKHFNVLFRTLESCLDKEVDHKSYKSFKLLYFDFADIPTDDKREDFYRSLFPIVNTNNLYSLFKSFDNRPDYWKMKYVNRVVDIIEANKEKNTKAHLKYVTNLHNNRSNK